MPLLLRRDSPRPRSAEKTTSLNRNKCLAIVSHKRQTYSGRICWITLSLAGIFSSVSVTVSPSLLNRARSQLPQLQAIYGALPTISRGKCAGKGLRPVGLQGDGTWGLVRLLHISGPDSDVDEKRLKEQWQTDIVHPMDSRGVKAPKLCLASNVLPRNA